MEPQDQSVWKTLRNGSTRIINTGTYILLVLGGLGVLGTIVKFIHDETQSNVFEFEIRMIGERAKPGDQVKIDPLDKIFELNTENKVVITDDINKIKGKNIKVTLFPQKGEQQIITSFYVSEESNKILLVCHFLSKK